jgi:hypothetical protein
MSKVLASLGVVEIGRRCPVCHGPLFSVSPSPNQPPGVLGVGKCLCRNKFVVRLTLMLKDVIASMFDDVPEIRKIVLERLFP